MKCVRVTVLRVGACAPAPVSVLVNGWFCFVLCVMPGARWGLQVVPLLLYIATCSAPFRCSCARPAMPHITTTFTLYIHYIYSPLPAGTVTFRSGTSAPTSPPTPRHPPPPPTLQQAARCVPGPGNVHPTLLCRFCSTWNQNPDHRLIVLVVVFHEQTQVTQ